MRPEKIILINAGTQTRLAFRAGAQDTPCKSYKSKRMLLHIGAAGSIDFIYKNVSVDLSNAYVFTRLRATDPHFCGMLYEFLSHHQIPVNDPISLSYPFSAEKITQMLLLALSNIRTPESFIFREESFALNKEYLREHISFPAVYKLDGSRGTKVYYVASFEELEALVAKKPNFLLALVQPFIDNTFDTRTLVAYDTILGTISRTRAQGYLNNIAQGASAARYDLTEAERAIAIAAAKACRIDFAGVDMIHTPQGPIVLEVNKSPQIAGFESVHPVKVFSEIAKLITQKYMP